MTSPKRLTVERILSTRATVRDVWLSDNDGGRGFGRLLVRVAVCGTRLLYFRGSRDGVTYIIPLGRFHRESLEGYLTLEQGRAQVRHYGALMHDPQRTQEFRLAAGLSTTTLTPSTEAAPTTEAPILGLTLLDLCGAYVAYLEQERSKSSVQGTRLDVKNYIAPSPWAGLPASQVSTKDIMEMLRSIRQRSTPHKTNRIRTVLMAAYGLAMRAIDDPGVSADLLRFGIVTNPVSSVKKLRTKEEQLERALSSAELGEFWRVLTSLEESNAMKYRVIRISILLGGQRCTQLSAALVRNVNADSRTLTLFDGKGQRAKPRVHLLPLSPLVWAEIEPLLEEARKLGRTYLFSARSGDGHIGEDGVSHAVHEVSSMLLQAGRIKEPICYRDIRRTVETRMSDLEIDQEVRAEIQSHDMGGVQKKHYNRATFLPQKRRALEQWQQYVLQCADDTHAAAAAVRYRESCG